MDAFQGRIHSLVKWKKIKNEVLDKLSEPTVILFLQEFRDFCQKKKIKQILSSLYWVHACFLYLHWLLFYPSFSKYKSKYKVPSTSTNDMVTFFTYQV